LFAPACLSSATIRDGERALGRSRSLLSTPAVVCAQIEFDFNLQKDESVSLLAGAPPEAG
jgi:hypothetical protein